MKEITAEERKQVNLQLLKYLDQICREQKIEYSLTGGTLLGAIRHKGFIPWDDDVDVFLIRPEYEKLDAYLRTQNEYYWITPDSDKNYYLNYGRLMDKKTKIVDEGIDEQKHYGLFIDVCIVDGLPDNVMARKWHVFKIQLCYRARRCLTYSNEEFIPQSPIKRVIKNTFRWCCGVLGRRWWMSRIDSLSRKYPFDTGIYVGNVMSNYGAREIMHYSSFQKYLDVPFEDCMFRMIQGWEEYLTNIYGDYMTLPPEDERNGHCKGKAYWLDEKT